MSPKNLIEKVRISHFPFRISNRGFTLLELLVVIAILGILLSVGFVFYQRAQANARDQQRISDLSSVKISLEQYFSDDNFVYPASNAGEIDDADCGGALTWGTSPLTCGGFNYMKVLPRDPGNSPQYCYVAAGTNFDLYAQMENSNNASAGSPFTVGCGTYNYRVQGER